MSLAQHGRRWIRGRNMRPYPATVARIALLFLVICQSAAAGQLDKVILFNIRSEALDKALLQFGTQAHVQISFASGVPAMRFVTPELRGSYTGASALSQLLRGSHLAFVVRGRHRDVVEIIPAADPPLGPKDSQHGSAKRPGGAPLQEVTITGTHIHGAPAGSEPLTVITQTDIEDSGYPTLEQFMQSIPQNSSAVGSGGQELNQDSLAGNLGFGTGVDLRGLGYDSTLVLVNGHRIAPAGANGAFTDISVIPLSAIKRIEILTDGASAIYGSDAIGGVVNYILKSGASGEHTTLQYGGVTSGGLKDVRASQSLGSEWSGGGGFLSYEYHDESPLSAADRSYSRSAPQQDLLPEIRANSIFGTLRQQVDDRLELTGDIFYSDRHNSAVLGTILPQPQVAETREYQAALEAEWRLADHWHVTARASYGRNTTSNTVPGALQKADSPLAAANLDADGIVATLPSGQVRAAMGLEVRETRLSQTLTGAAAYTPEIDKGRTVDAAYAELRVPLLPAAHARGAGGVPVMELDLAGRYEHYSDFGSSANPEVGLAWVPNDVLRIRGTWSSSFAAPQLWESNGPQFSYLFNSPDPLSVTGRSAVLELAGANPRLGPQTSTQWTAGMDLMPLAMRGVRSSVTYYRIVFKNRINAPGIPIFAALAQGDLYSAFIQRNPSPGLLAQLTSSPYLYTNATLLPFPGFGPPETLADAVAVADNALQNIGRTVTDGVDLAATYEADRWGWRYHLGINGTYILRYDQTDVVGGPVVSALSTLNHPTNFRARASGGISRGPAALAVSVNYFNRYEDNTIPTQTVPIASWTTFDVQGRYQLFADRSRNDPLSDISIALSCTNCLNRNPPTVSPLSEPLSPGYDPVNANPLGRFVSLSLDKEW